MAGREPYGWYNENMGKLSTTQKQKLSKRELELLIVGIVFMGASAAYYILPTVAPALFVVGFIFIIASLVMGRSKTR